MRKCVKSRGVFTFLSVLMSLHVALADAPLQNALTAPTLPSAEDMRTLSKEQKSVFENKTISIAPLWVSAENEFTEGPVQKHRLENASFNTLPFFIIGNDKHSAEWVKANNAYLQSIHALGIVTPVKSHNEIKILEAKTGLHFLPANINGLSKLIETTHYPVLIYKNWVLQ